MDFSVCLEVFEKIVGIRTGISVVCSPSIVITSTEEFSRESLEGLVATAGTPVDIRDAIQSNMMQ